MKRRDFLKATGATGLFILFRAEALAAPTLVPNRPAGYPQDFNAYLRIGPDGRVGCFVGKVEMGQGNMTALAMLAAEELDVPLDRVDMLMGDTDLCPWDGGTGGSLSMWQFGPVLRAAGAEARAVLLQLAGEQFQVAPDRLEVQAGVVTVKGDPARQVTYGQLVQGRRPLQHVRRRVDVGAGMGEQADPSLGEAVPLDGIGGAELRRSAAGIDRHGRREGVAEVDDGHGGSCNHSSTTAGLRAAGVP